MSNIDIGEPTKWDLAFFEECQTIAKRSKDPSTKVGACIVRPDKTIAAKGYNGFPRGMLDSEERYANREEKYSRTVHGEMNAILTAREPLHGCTLYTWPFAPCERCAVMVIQTGIVEVVAPVLPEHLRERWQASLEKTADYLTECGVRLRLVDLEPKKEPEA
jgi:dCMP deaminase